MSFDFAKLDKKKIFVWFAVVVTVLILLAIFAPLIYAGSFAEKEVDGVLKDKTQKTDGGLWDREYAVFSKNEDEFYSEVYFVEVKRKNLIWWEAEAKTFEKFQITFDSEDWEMDNERNLESLEEAVKNGELTKGRYLAGQNPISQNYDIPGKVVNEFVNPINDSKIQIVNSLEEFGNNVLIDGQETGLKNVYSINYEFAPVAENIDKIYYTKYKVDGENIVYTGKIYSYDIENGEEKAVFDFEQEEIVSVMANSSYILYGLGGGEVGIINLETGEKAVMANLEMVGASDDFRSSAKVIDISEFSGVVEANDLESFEKEKTKYLMVNLETGEFEIEWSD